MYMSKKKIVPALLATAMAVPVAAPASAEQLTDIQKSWAKTYIQALVDKDVLSGMGNGKYEPAKTMTRAEIAVALTRALDLELDAAAAAKFKDVPDWAKPYVGALVKAGIAAGMDANTYGSNLKVTREQLAVFYVRALGLEPVAKEAQGLELTFKDAASISEYAKKHVALAAKIGFIHGFPDNTFGPKQNADRAQLAKLTYDLYFNGETFVQKANELFGTVSVQSVTATNGTVTVMFDKALTAAPQAADLEVTQAVNGSSPMEITPSDITLSEDKKSVSFKIPTVEEKEEKQSVVISVAYRGGAAKSAEAFTVASKYLMVEDVTALNPSEIKVIFNKEADKSTAEDEGNYTLQNGSHPRGAKLSDDKKSVILRLAAPLANDAAYRVDVANVKDTNYNVMQKFEGTAKLFFDKEAPKLQKAEMMTDGRLKLTFNEPVQDTMTVKVDDTVVANGDTTKVTPATEAGDYSVTVGGLNDELKQTGNHTVTVYNVADTLAGKPNTLNIASLSYTVEADSSAPTVSSLTATGKNTFKVKFSEELAAAPTISVKKGSLVLKADAVQDAKDKTVYNVTVSSNDPTNNPLYGNNETSVQLSVNVKNMRDAAGFIGSEYNGTVTLTEQSGAPTVVSTALNKVNVDNRTISIKFDKELASVDKNKITVRKDNVIMPVQDAKVNASAKDTVDITLSSVTAGTYNVNFAAGAVTSQEGSAKNSELSTTATASTNTDALTVAKPQVLTGNVIELKYSEDMGDSATNAANYTLDNQPLPSGTTIDFVGDRKTVQIKLPAGSVAKRTEKQLAIGQGVRSQSGKSLASDAATHFQIELEDNTNPTLTAAQFQDVISNNSSKIRLTFSENLAEDLPATEDGTAIDTDDFVVTVNGIKQTVKQVIDGTKGDNIITLELANGVNVGQNVQVEVQGTGAGNNEIEIKDRAGNALASGTVNVSR
jgi:hypothetical protein